MPIYLRKNQTFSPPSGSTGGDDGVGDNMDGFLVDPDQVRDTLPQPYRMIDKVLTSIVDNAFMVIDSREHERAKEAAKYKPPSIEGGVQMKEHGNATALSITPDGKYVVIGLPNGVAAVDAATQETVAQWSYESVEVVTLHVALLSENSYIICTVDDMGVARVFIFSEDAIYLLHTLNESDSGQKVVAGKCEASNEGEYIGVSFEATETGDSWLEIHRTPHEDWQRELEKALTARGPKTSPKAPDGQDIAEDAVVDYSHPSEGGQTSDLDTSRSQSPGSNKGGSPVPPSGPKFSPPTAVLKIRPQGEVQGVTWSTPLALMKTVDQGDVIGSGANHLLSSLHLEQRHAAWEQMHSQYLPYKPVTPEPAPVPTFHFLTPGRLLPQGLEHQATEGQPSVVAVWWTGGHQLTHYSLTKQSKELEHRPDLVWPFSSEVVASAVTPCTSLLALALCNGNLVLWDKHYGLQQQVVHIGGDARVRSLHFLDPSICPQVGGAYPPYGTRAACYVLATCADSTSHLALCGRRDGHSQLLSEVNSRSESAQLQHTVVLPIQGLPELVVVCRADARVFIQDTLTSSVICEVALPGTYILSRPWEPMLVSGAAGDFLYLKGEQKHWSQLTKDDIEHATSGDPKPEHPYSLFVFNLRTVGLLDRYRVTDRPSIPFVEHTVVENRVEALLRERLSQQGGRRSRLQTRWHQLKEELSLIKAVREGISSQKHAQIRSAFTESTIVKSPLGNVTYTAESL